ncbi:MULTISPECIES: hypothetical protein [unclassified Vibrio]|uniref:hypothetical protein n=1 Tax=unclassified Vibrio TaxID=2614977 RepID=UPI0029651242|nr:MULTISPECIES: hypothetical protein [unclassified Vibrio]MDG2665832.1 hypothetical protein [Vibrio parahaemolyticus]MDW2100510.1 hypothetical protein [Vibrio sp. 1580]MDW2275591.1 hypothetical protein [Vibrio sp. 1074]MDW2287421.1 hypothetical protein [Vibrio sp. 1562]
MNNEAQEVNDSGLDSRKSTKPWLRLTRHIVGQYITCLVFFSSSTVSNPIGALAEILGSAFGAALIIWGIGSLVVGLVTLFFTNWSKHKKVSIFVITSWGLLFLLVVAQGAHNNPAYKS